MGDLETFGNSVVIMTGGSVENHIGPQDNSTVTISGGFAGNNIFASGNSTTTMSGGSVGFGLRVYDNTMFFLDGSNFSVTAGGVTTALTIGQGLSVLSPLIEGEMYAAGTISGTLASGETLDNAYRIYNTGDYAGTADIIIIPEPAALSLLVLGGIGIWRRNNEVWPVGSISAVATSSRPLRIAGTPSMKIDAGSMQQKAGESLNVTFEQEDVWDWFHDSIKQLLPQNEYGDRCMTSEEMRGFLNKNTCWDDEYIWQKLIEVCDKKMSDHQDEITRLRKQKVRNKLKLEVVKKLGNIPSKDELDRLLRYEGAIERQLYKAMNQLERLQRLRLGDHVPAPVEVDVDVHTDQNRSGSGFVS